MWGVVGQIAGDQGPDKLLIRSLRQNRLGVIDIQRGCRLGRLTWLHLARERRAHAAVGTHFLSLFVLLKPPSIHRRARRNQQRDYLYVVSTLGFGRGVEPTVKRPPQGRTFVPFVLSIDRHVVFEQQADDAGVSAVCGPVQPGFAVRRYGSVHTVL
jgi:hypothetical protein